MATGLGKTVVSAFDIQRLLKQAPGRVLYLCHDKRILRKSRKTYEEVVGSGYSYGFFHGSEKHLHEVDVLFATFQTMANWREAFLKDEFRYIVVDEVHHAHAATFRPTIEYFEPEWMAGYTATPEREDGLDIAPLFGGKPVFELGIFKALARRYLCGVDYRVMTDEIQNAGVLDTPVGKLSIAELNRTIFVPKRDEEIGRIISEKAREVENPRTIIFCASIAHAERLAGLMPHAAIVHSKLGEKQNDQSLEAFACGDVDTILTVDMLNEGIDIPEANVIVFLRSTSSRRIFLQQLGRGLRKALGKLKVLVLDFVANCERIEMIDQLQQGVLSELKSLPSGPKLDGEEDAEATRSPLELTLDGVEFDERLWKLMDVLRGVRDGYTIEVLTKQLLAKAAVFGRTPTWYEVEGDPEMAHPETFTRAFGTDWNGVLTSVGLTPIRQRDCTVEELTDLLLAMAKRLGRAPTQREVSKDPSLPHSETVCEVFGQPWTGIIKQIGLTPVRGLTIEQLSELLLQKALSLGRTPTYDEVNVDPHMPSAVTYANRFKTTWNGVLKAVGLPPNHVKNAYDVRTLEDQLLRKAAQLGRSPTTTEVDDDPNMASVMIYVTAFKSTWNQILTRLGLPLNRS